MTQDYDNTGILSAERGPAMQPWLGGRLYLLDPKPLDIDPRDIARGLAFQCRFTGHCAAFYSIAQHSILCASMAENEYGDTNLARIMLLHDAAEAYMGDMNRPLKSVLPEYRKIERGIWLAVAKRFGLPAEMPAEVKEIDNKVLSIEKTALLPNSEEWPGVPAASVGAFVAMDPMTALLVFNDVFARLFPDDEVLKKPH